MLVVMKKPHIEMNGYIPSNFLKTIKERFPGQVQDDLIPVKEMLQKYKNNRG